MNETPKTMNDIATKNTERDRNKTNEMATKTMNEPAERTMNDAN